MAEATVFTRWWPFGLKSGEIECVHTIRLLRGGGKSGVVLWQADVYPESQCAPLRTFTVGHSPFGFRDTVSLGTTRLTGSYILEVRGIGFGSESFSVN